MGDQPTDDRHINAGSSRYNGPPALDLSSRTPLLSTPQIAAMFNKKTNETVSEKPSEIQVEDAVTENHKLEDGGDYSGATAKTDPKEIALVKKLDIRIMGILWAMYFLVSPVRKPRTLDALTSLELPRPQCHRPSTTEQPRRRPWPRRHAIQYLYQHPLRWVN